MNNLLAKLEGAETGSRELSDEVLLACGWYHRVDKRLPDRSQWGWLKRDPWDEKAVLIMSDPSPTESIDAALTLVPEGAWVASEMGCGGHADWWCWHVNDAEACAATPALALIIAIMKARLG